MFLKASYDSKCLHKFFLKFVKLNNFDGVFITSKEVEQIAFIATLICWVGIAMNICITSILTFKSTTFDTLTSDPCVDPATMCHLVMKSTFVLLARFLTAMWIFPSAIDFCTALLLHKEFYLFRKSFAAKITREGQYLGSLNNERRRYLQMCRLMEAADDVLALHHGASFSCNIITICLIMYSIIYYPFLSQNTPLTIFYVFWLFSSITDMVIVCSSGILVQSAVS